MNSWPNLGAELRRCIAAFCLIIYFTGKNASKLFAAGFASNNTTCVAHELRNEDTEE